MADLKISALTASTTPLAGTEVLPIVQSSTTKQVSVANLTAGRAISATQLTLTTGNLIVASGKGVDFSATAGTGTSELFADYEEGTFTPVWTGSTTNPTVTYSTQTGQYTKIGNVVYFNLSLVTTAATGGSGNLVITGLPFSATRIGTIYPTFVYNFASTATAPKQQATQGSTLLNYTNNTDNTNAAVTTLTGSPGTAFLFCGGFYYV